MKRLRPIEESRISRLRRLYNSSISRHALSRKERRWHAYSDDGLAQVQETLDAIAEPIVEGNALELFISEAELDEESGGEEKANEFSRRSVKRYFSDIEPASEELAEKIEQVIEKYMSKSFSKSTQRIKAYNRSDEEAYLKAISSLRGDKEVIFRKYKEFFNMLVAAEFLASDGTVFRRGLLGKKQPLKDENGNIVKILPPQDYKKLFEDILAKAEESHQMLEQRFSNHPKTRSKLKQDIAAVAFLAIMTVAGLAVVFTIVAAVAYPSQFKEFTSVGQSILEYTRTQAQPITNAFSRALDWVHRQDRETLALGVVGTVLVIVLKAIVGINLWESWKKRRELKRKLNCLIEVNKITAALSQKANVNHELVRQLCVLPEDEVEETLRELDRNLGSVKELEAQLKSKMSCLGISLE